MINSNYTVYNEAINNYISTNSSLLIPIAIILTIVLTEILFYFVMKQTKKSNWFGVKVWSIAFAFAILFTCVMGIPAIIWVMAVHWEIILMSIGLVGLIVLFFWINYAWSKKIGLAKNQGYKYASGDMVKLKNNLVLGKSYGGRRWISEKKLLQGKVVTIKSEYPEKGCYNLEEANGNLVFTEDMIARKVK